MQLARRAESSKTPLPADPYVIEFKAARLNYFLRVLIYGGLTVVGWHTFAEWFDLPLVGLSIAGLLASAAVRALVGALIHVPFHVVRIGPDWVFGPGLQAGVQRRAHREEVREVRVAGRTLVLETADEDPIDLGLDYYGSEATDLSQRLSAWFAGGSSLRIG